ncbi:HDOD domain-containing protein [Rheinheimera sp.]|uniref:HDOD domain-containing protein n=1 Tax=Rheinheimera sp. TaxID=1869214 RepID=UPI0027B91997|nr:HDOD domain-containing protein [Rheinheimera sp.]
MNHEPQTQAFVAIIVLSEPQRQASFRHLLQQSLPNWFCHFVTDAKSARHLLKTETVALLMTEWLQPEDSGDLLLDFCCRHSPATVRILLAEEHTDTLLLATNHAAQILLAQPVHDLQVIQLFLRVQLLYSGHFTAHSRYQLGQINSLPVQRNHYQTLIQLLADPDSSTHSLASTIAREAPLAARLVQIANSAYLGFNRQTVDLAEVVVRLGRSMIKAVAFAVQLHSQYEGKIRPDLHQQLLHESFELAGMASQLAKTQQSGPALADKAFLAGLLQVLGPLVLLSSMPVQLQRLTEEDMFQEGIPDHCLISAYLLLLWGFEQDICDAVMYRLSLNEVAQPGLLQTILHLSSYVLIFRRQQQDDSLPTPCWTALAQFQLTDTFCRLQQQVTEPDL